MVFSDSIFIFYFLPLTFLYILLPGKFRLFFIIAVSLIFYFWGSGLGYTFILIASIFFNFFAGVVIFERGKASGAVLAAAIIANLLSISYFKYAYFFSSNIDLFGGSAFSLYFQNIILPIGISFFTFQAISFLVDIWRGEVRQRPKFLEFGAYLAFFPQLIAGPIVRYTDVIDDFRRHAVSAELFVGGASRFGHGLAKKILIADQAGAIADAAFGLPAGAMTSADAWVGAIAYTIQIYFDFSGYSDMAIGIGQMFGIRFNENFLRPYGARSITEFWRRWHVSLSTWFRDYLYIPLGGNRSTAARTYRNLVIVFLATGLWHGAQWTFVLWGVYHGAFVLIERVLMGSGAASPRQPWLRWVYCLPVVIFGWVLFRAADIGQAGEMMAAMVFLNSGGHFALSGDVWISSSNFNAAMTLLGAAIFVAGRGRSIGALTGRVPSEAETAWHLHAYGLVALVLASLFALSSQFSPFLYFQF